MGEVEEIGPMTEADLIASIMERYGHLAPPPNSFTAEDYIKQAAAQNIRISSCVAVATLLSEVEAGRLHGKKMAVKGRQRWVFWPANGDGS